VAPPIDSTSVVVEVARSIKPIGSVGHAPQGKRSFIDQQRKAYELRSALTSRRRHWLRFYQRDFFVEPRTTSDAV